MSRLGLTFVAVSVLAATPALAGDWGNPSQEWNGHLRFNSETQQQVDLNRADMMKRAKGGYYDQWQVNQTTNNYNYGDTNIGTMNTSNAIGSQNVNTVNVDGEGNTVTQDTNNTANNSGDTGAQTNTGYGDYSSYNN